MTYDLVVKGGTLVMPGTTAPGEVAIKDGTIVDIAGPGAFPAERADAVWDATGLHVLPGVIDSQVHFREPGLEHKEDLEHGMMGAALGGVTAVFEMPNTNPNTTTEAAIADKFARAHKGGWTDHAFYVGADGTNTAELAELERLPGVCAVKVFMGASTGSLLVSEDEPLRDILQGGSRRVAVHSEDEHRLRARAHLAKAYGDPRGHPLWRDAESALRSTHRLVNLARAAGRRVHVLHITTADEIAYLAQNKDLATVEVLPQHLTFAAPEIYAEIGAKAQQNPPIRAARHRDGLWWGIRSGVIDVLATDHAPHTAEEKARPYPTSPSGMSGTQTMLPLMLDHVANGRLSLERLVDLVCYGPQRVFGVAGKGRLAVGYDGDLTLVDLKAEHTVRDAEIVSKSGWTSLDGKTLTGRPVGTIVRGHVVMRDGELQGRPVGRPIAFLEGRRLGAGR